MSLSAFASIVNVFPIASFLKTAYDFKGQPPSSDGYCHEMLKVEDVESTLYGASI